MHQSSYRTDRPPASQPPPTHASLAVSSASPSRIHRASSPGSHRAGGWLAGRLVRCWSVGCCPSLSLALPLSGSGAGKGGGSSVSSSCSAVAADSGWELGAGRYGFDGDSCGRQVRLRSRDRVYFAAFHHHRFIVRRVSFAHHHAAIRFAHSSIWVSISMPPMPRPPRT
jgi:hypothetical protein